MNLNLMHQMSPFGLGLSPVPPAQSRPDGLAGAISNSAINEPPLWSPNHPMFWAGLLIFVAVGAAGVSGKVRLGPATIGGAVGKA